MEGSKFHFFSFGKVAANKQRNSMKVEVFPQEKFTMSAGEVTDNVEKIDVAGVDADGRDYKGQIETKTSITCVWLPIGEPHRVMPPDVRRDETVMIYRFADSNYYFWSSINNETLRRLETVTWWFSGIPNNDGGPELKRTADNGYLIEISSHDKHIIVSTSKINGEACRYELQFDLANGIFSLKDDLGNEIELNSPAGILESTIENQIIKNTKQYIVNCETMEVNASKGVDFNTPKVTLSTDIQVNGASLLKGFANFTAGIGGGGYGDTKATLTFKGSVTQIGNWESQGNLTVTGTGTFTGTVSAPNIR